MLGQVTYSLHRWMRYGALCAFAVCSTVLLVAATAPRAHATNEDYCNTFLSGYDTCMGARHSLVNNTVYQSSGNRVCAGARDANLNFYGSYICGGGQATHCYSGNRLLYPLAHNGNSFGVSLRGVQGYGSGVPSPA